MLVPSIVAPWSSVVTDSMVTKNSHVARHGQRGRMRAMIGSSLVVDVARAILECCLPVLHYGSQAFVPKTVARSERYCGGAQLRQDLEAESTTGGSITGVNRAMLEHRLDDYALLAGSLLLICWCCCRSTLVGSRCFGSSCLGLQLCLVCSTRMRCAGDMHRSEWPCHALW